MIISRLWIIGVTMNILLAAALYHTKYKVVDLERSYVALTQKLLTLQETHHTLQAEYSLLSCPKRLAHLAQRHILLGTQEGANHQATDQHMNGIRLVSTLRPMLGLPEEEELIGDDQDFP